MEQLINQNHTKLFKIARFYTMDAPDEIKIKEFKFDEYFVGISKYIFDALMSEFEIFEIQDIRTKKEVSIAYFTTNANLSEEKKLYFNSNMFNSSNSILNYLIEKEDLNKIERIEKEWIIE